jgi:hypothetical protein
MPITTNKTMAVTTTNAFLNKRSVRICRKGLFRELAFNETGFIPKAGWHLTSRFRNDKFRKLLH